MPCDNRNNESMTNYLCVLGELQNVLDTLPSNKVIMMGDFNADPIRRSRFWGLVENFSSDNGLIIEDLVLPRESFTFLSRAYNTTSWIDHVILSETIGVSSISIRYDWALYDHFPIVLEINSNSLNLQRNFQKKSEEPVHIQWSLLEKENHKKRYNMKVIKEMSSMSVCEDFNCADNHSASLDAYYNKLLTALKTASLLFASAGKKTQSKSIAGWNTHCKHKYREARDALNLWRQCGKPRGGNLFENMKATRKIFQKALKFCRFKEQQIKNQNMAKDLSEGKCKSFWRKVKKRRGDKVAAADKIDGVQGNKNIANLFAAKFKEITGTPNTSTASLPESPHGQTDPCTGFTTADVRQAVDKLNLGSGSDGIDARHLKYLDSVTILYLKRFFNACLIHSYIPQGMLNSIIHPRVKNKYGNSEDSKNYREVMLSSNLFKVFEYLLLPVLERTCFISHLMFGYRKKTSTTDAVMLFKEIISRYTSEGSTIYACFLDLSKAFERVDHGKLLRKIKKFKVPSHIYRMIEFILSYTRTSVKYEDEFSEIWQISRGVRQGGVLSAFLFSLYIEDILQAVANEESGCYIGIRKINVQAYADDIVIYCPTSAGLQKLLEKFWTCAREHDLVVNLDKTKVMKFGRKDNSVFTVGGNVIECTSEYKYLGVILSDDCSISKDMTRANTVLNKSVGMMLRQFGTVDLKVKIKLFNSLCVPLYGSQLWYNRGRASNSYKSLAVSYHHALKRIIGYPKYYSNHLTCQYLGCLTFEHMLNFTVLKYYMSLCSSLSPCLVGLHSFIRKFSSFKKDLDVIFRDKYQLHSIDDNDLDAIVSMLHYVQFREEASLFVGL